MKYRVGVKTAQDSDWVFNALVFDTKVEAETYAKNLFSQWMAVTEYTIQEIK